jgi:hypothetical protein
VPRIPARNPHTPPAPSNPLLRDHAPLTRGKFHTAQAPRQHHAPPHLKSRTAPTAKGHQPKAISISQNNQSSQPNHESKRSQINSPYAPQRRANAHPPRSHSDPPRSPSTSPPPRPSHATKRGSASPRPRPSQPKPLIKSPTRQRNATPKMGTSPPIPARQHRPSETTPPQPQGPIQPRLATSIQTHIRPTQRPPTAHLPNGITEPTSLHPNGCPTATSFTPTIKLTSIPSFPPPAIQTPHPHQRLNNIPTQPLTKPNCPQPKRPQENLPTTQQPNTTPSQWPTTTLQTKIQAPPPMKSSARNTP